MPVIRHAYSLIAWMAQPLLRRKLARRAVAERGYGQWIEERFGRYDLHSSSGANTNANANVCTNADGRGPLIWVHAVSLGETRAAAILVNELRRSIPGMRLLLTHGTATGRAEGQKILQAGDVQVWQPWDSLGAVRRFLQNFKPALGILMETEIWPNLILESAAAGIPLALANARLSEKSLHAARRGAWLMRPCYAALTAVWAQTESDAARLRAMGAQRAEVFGNLKFDARPDESQLARGRVWRAASARPVVMLASSRETEEADFLDHIQRLGASGKTSGVQWLIVPRHPQRFDEVEGLALARHLSVSRRTNWQASAEAADIWLGDSMGEMSTYYGLADVVLLGGSFAPLGGQNLIEAAACGCPVLMGPHTFNFDEAARLSESQGAARRVADMGQAVAESFKLVTQGDGHRAMRDAALAFAGAHRGASSRMAHAALQLIEGGRWPRLPQQTQTLQI